jgi:hypothetical protein
VPDRYHLQSESLFEPAPQTGDVVDAEVVASGNDVETGTALAPTVEKPRNRSVFALAGKGIDWCLDRVAADPDGKPSFTRFLGKLGIDFIPWAGPLKKIADARAEAKTGDPQKIAEGRTRFVIGVTELALDTGTAGFSFFIPYDEGATGLRTLKDYMKKSAIFRRAAFLVPDVLTWGTALLMKSERLRGFVDKLYMAGIENPEQAAGEGTEKS